MLEMLARCTRCLSGQTEAAFDAELSPSNSSKGDNCPNLSTGRTWKRASWKASIEGYQFQHNTSRWYLVAQWGRGVAHSTRGTLALVPVAKKP